MKPPALLRTPIVAACVVTVLLFASPSIVAQPASEQHAEHVPPVILESVELKVPDADGLALGDLTGNGKIDILTSEGRNGNTAWFEQGRTWTEWTRHHIASIEQPPDESEIEGNALGDVDGDGHLEAISLNQPNGEILLHQRGEDAREEWRSAIIQVGRPLLQDALVTDIDGDGQSDLVYTWEGRQEGQGGVHWLKFVGDDPMNANHWRDHVMTTHESAWWLALRRIDISGNGAAVDIVFTARHLSSRNPGSRPGLFWMEPPEDVTEPWTVHAIDETLPHPLHVDLGDLSGDGHGRDLVVGGFDTDTIYWYEFSNDWQRHELEVPEIDGIQPNRVWNVKTVRLGGEREAIFAAVNAEFYGQDNPDREEGGAWLLYEHVNGKFQPYVLRKIDYRHPTDDRILLFDVTGDGQAELFLPDSGVDVDRLHIWRLGRDW